MFKNSVNTTPLTSDAANMYFRNVTGETYGSDNTFLATLRALVAPRLPEGESVHLSFGRSDYSATKISDTPAGRMVHLICDDIPGGNGQIYVHNLANRDEANNVANIELLKRQFCETYAGWQYLDKITAFYQKSFKVACFINHDTKSVALFVEQMNLQKLHYLQMSTLAFLPWYFNVEQGMDEVEMEMVRSLRERNSATWEKCIEKLAQRFDFEAGRIKYLLDDFETRYERAERDRVRNSIRDVDRRLSDIDRQFAEYLRQREDMNIRLLGLERKIQEGGPSELLDYFLCNRKLYLEDVSESSMSFAVRDYLDYFDEDAAKIYIGNKSGYFYHRCNRNMTEEDMEKLLTAIFIDQTLRIRFCAAYQFDLRGSVSARGRHHFGMEFNEYRPNPHIDEYSCMGNYKRVINDALLKRDYITALEQCIASAKSLNFHDNPVMENFVSQFTDDGGTSYKAIELPDGRVVAPRDAIKWIHEQEAAAEAAASAVSVPDEPASAERVQEVTADAAERIAAVNAETENQVNNGLPF